MAVKFLMMNFVQSKLILILIKHFSIIMDLSFLTELSGVQMSYLFIVVFLFLLAIIDLWVGVSNDAVNFIGSAVGCKASKLKHVLAVAAVGVFVGAAFSNGMMEVARSGVFNPEMFTFQEVMVIFLAVMVSDVFLLDLFNSLGLPTSTTVSMVFELLGAAFITALLSESGGGLDMLNTNKAIVMIISIFLSVAVAFIFGFIVQWISRVVFSFNYKKSGSLKMGLFGGISITSIVYFMLIKGLKGTTIISKDVKAFVDENTAMLLLCCLVLFTFLMWLLHRCRVNVLRIVVLVGTFSLAMAFAGNDLVNFIGVTLAGLDSFNEYIASGLAPGELTMGSLSGTARTPIFYLLAAGLVMVVALCMSKKAHKVLQTSIDLSKQQNSENESFGSSSFARNLVRASTKSATVLIRKTPVNVRRWVNKRFTPLEEREDVAFDLVRASVNLVLAGLLIAVGTSLKLPLSTTYVTFMVGMGSSLADRAWGRESAVYRVTGVVSVIGGWFITAGAAFLIAILVALMMFFGGLPAMFVMIALVVLLLYRSNVKYNKKREAEKVDANMQVMFKSDDKEAVWTALKSHSAETWSRSLSYSAGAYRTLFNAFAKDSLRPMKAMLGGMLEEKEVLKKNRRIETKAMQRIDQQLAYECSTWYYLCSNSCQQMLNTLYRIAEPIKEHTEHSFTPLSPTCVNEFTPYCVRVVEVLEDINCMIASGNYGSANEISAKAKELKHELAKLRKDKIKLLHSGDGSLRTDFVYLNLIQESHELLSEVRNLLRGCCKYFA